jgi:hypothetical protein
MDPIAQALTAKVGFDPVSVKGNDRSLRLLGRVPERRAAELRMVFSALYAAARRASWGIDPSKLYFPRDEGSSEIVYAWRLILESKDNTPLPIEEIVRVISSVTLPKSAGFGEPLQEVRLGGLTPNRNEYNERGKGAAVFGKAVVGPARR